MSSVIVVDSSESEDEAPAKKNRLAVSAKPPSLGDLPGNPTRTHVKTKIPSGITVTRHRDVLLNPASVTTAAKEAERPTLSILPKLTAAFHLPVSQRERQTPTPPKQLLATPELQSAPSGGRKRKTPTPPQRPLHTPPAMCGNNGIVGSSSSTAAGPLPLITSVQSMAASTTPPLQLLATPPPQTSGISFSDQLMISPHLIHTHLPESTTITLHSPLGNITAASAVPNNNNNTNNNNNNANNINNNFKIMLPPKRQTVSPATASPLASPVLRTPPAAASPTSTMTAASAANIASTLRRIRPTTVLRQNDEVWLQQRQRAVAGSGDELLLSSSSANSPQSAPGSRPSSNPSSAHSSSPSPSALKSMSASASARSSPKLQATPPPVQSVLDLTDSPEKAATKCYANVVPVSSTPPPTAIPLKTAVVAAARSKTTKLNGTAPPPAAEDVQAAARVEPSSSPAAAAETAQEPEPTPTPTPLEADYEALIKACQLADPSEDMERLIETKLKRYYYDVHSSFVSSRGFLKNVRTVTERIRADPDLVYYNLKTIVDELKVRRKSKAVSNAEGDGGGGAGRTADSPAESASASVAAPTPSTGNKRTDEQIKKLNRALYILQKRIEKLEETDVDLDDDDSTYLQVERFKKRACQIYEKICDLTGESKSAHRMGKRPIQFAGTPIVQFNRTLQGYINRTREFPDYYDVMRMLEHCNRTYDLGLVNFEMTRIAQDAFLKVGKLLQTRRRNDLYETVTHFTANAKDPAAADPNLLAKLNENQKNRTKINEIIEKFAREQDMSPEEQKQARLEEHKKDESTESLDNSCASSSAATDNRQKDAKANAEEEERGKGRSADGGGGGGEEDDDEDDEEDDEEEELNDLDADVDVDKLTNGAAGGGGGGVEVIDLSDAESDSEEPGSARADLIIKDEIDRHEIVQGQVSEENDVPTAGKMAAEIETTPLSASPNAAAVQSATDKANRSVNLKNSTRTKTGSEEKVPTTTKTKHLSNGKLIDGDDSRAKPLPAVSLSSVGKLKIASVTSLQQPLKSANSKQTSSLGWMSNYTPSVGATAKSAAKLRNASPPSPAPAPASVAASPAVLKKPQRAVDEIVISDEEF